MNIYTLCITTVPLPPHTGQQFSIQHTVQYMRNIRSTSKSLSKNYPVNWKVFFGQFLIPEIFHFNNDVGLTKKLVFVLSLFYVIVSNVIDNLSKWSIYEASIANSSFLQKFNCNIPVFTSTENTAYMMKQEGDVPSIKSLLKLKKRYEAPTEEELPQNYRWASYCRLFLHFFMHSAISTLCQ